jgi:hypothetical protein
MIIFQLSPNTRDWVRFSIPNQLFCFFLFLFWTCRGGHINQPKAHLPCAVRVCHNMQPHELLRNRRPGKLQGSHLCEEQTHRETIEVVDQWRKMGCLGVNKTENYKHHRGRARKRNSKHKCINACIAHTREGNCLKSLELLHLVF